MSKQIKKQDNPADKRGTVTARTSQDKKRMLEALEKTMGIVTPAAAMVGVDRRQHYRWCDDDPEYAQKAAEMRNIALDYTETQLFKRIKANDTTAMIFFLKTQGKKRGYIERVENEFILHEKILVEIT